MPSRHTDASLKMVRIQGVKKRVLAIVFTGPTECVRFNRRLLREIRESSNADEWHDNPGVPWRCAIERMPPENPGDEYGPLACLVIFPRPTTYLVVTAKLIREMEFFARGFHHMAAINAAATN